MAARSPSASSGKKKGKRKAKATAGSAKKRGKTRPEKGAATNNGSDAVALPPKKGTSRSNEDGTETIASDSVKQDSLSRRTFLDCFWTLASTDQSERVGAANGIVSFLVADQAKLKADKEDEDAAASAVIFGACSDNLRYALKRLVKGLQSSRAGARQGFSLALIGVLQHPVFSKTISIREVLDFGDTVLDYKSIKKRHEARECMFGKVFLYMAVQRSARLIIPEDVVRVTENLLVLAHKKPFLREICLETVGEIAVAAPLEFCRDTILPILVRDIAAFRDTTTTDATDATVEDDATPLGPEDLALAFMLTNRFAALKQSKGADAGLEHLYRLTEDDSARSWIEPLKASSSVFPRVHSVWTHMLAAIARPEQSATTLRRCLAVWQTVVEPHFFGRASHERKYLGFQLMHIFLEYLQRHQHHEHCAKLFTPNLVQCMYTNVMDEGTLLHDAALKAVRALLTQPPVVRVTVAVSLMAAPRRKTRAKNRSETGKALVEQLLGYTKEVR